MTGRGLALVGLAALAAGCARFPSTPPGEGSKLVVITMTVAGKLRTGQEEGSGGLPYVYMVALRPSFEANPIEQGPIPVIGPPWGNGFVAGTVTHFVWWNPQTLPRYQLYRFRDNLLNEYFVIGTPINFAEVPPEGRTLSFTLDLRQLVSDPNDVTRLQSLQLNFLTMDRIAQSGNSKAWDALGNSRDPLEINSPVTIPLRSPGVFDNRRAGFLEPEGDTADPDLDIIDWSVEVRIP